MDLLFKRYASPFVLIDEMLMIGNFHKFIVELKNQVDDEKVWEFYLHKVNDVSFEEFKRRMNDEPENHQMTQNDIETTVNESYQLLNGFKPENFKERG